MTLSTISTPNVKERLEEIRTSLENETVSYGELAELSNLVDYIEDGDTLLLEAAGVSEETIENGIRCKSMGCHSYAMIGDFCNNCTKYEA